MKRLLLIATLIASANASANIELKSCSFIGGLFASAAVNVVQSEGNSPKDAAAALVSLTDSYTRSCQIGVNMRIAGKTTPDVRNVAYATENTVLNSGAAREDVAAVHMSNSIMLFGYAYGK